jgi:uncharacterized membrane protein
MNFQYNEPETPSMQVLIMLKLLALFFLALWGPETKLYAQNFDIRGPKATSLTNFD